MDNLTRRQVRYICFRLQNEAKGGGKALPEAGIMENVEQIKKHFETQEDFGGWEMFGKTWDVDDRAYFVAISRKKSLESEWNETLIEESQELIEESQELIEEDEFFESFLIE
jgi:hypothetical protein